MMPLVIVLACSILLARLMTDAAQRVAADIRRWHIRRRTPDLMIKAQAQLESTRESFRLRVLDLHRGCPDHDDAAHVLEYEQKQMQLFDSAAKEALAFYRERLEALTRRSARPEDFTLAIEPTTMFHPMTRN